MATDDSMPPLPAIYESALAAHQDSVDQARSICELVNFALNEAGNGGPEADVQQLNDAMNAAIKLLASVSGLYDRIALTQLAQALATKEAALEPEVSSG